MSLKRSIVVVNRFTVKTPTGGTNGATPGRYVIRYMAREGACEAVAPIIHPRFDLYTTRYMARQKATERARTVIEADREVAKVTGLGGLGFGYGSVSLGHDQLIAASEDIQEHFEKGHTIYETVISFDHDYLRDNGLVPEDFVCTRRGDYAGVVDHVKLRMGIMNGLERMATKYDDLRYVGTIQTDTEHVHCHLAMFDAGDGNITMHGQQRGVIPQKHFMMLRRGIDNWIDEKQHVRHMSSAIGYERRNALTYVKKWTFDEMLRNSTPQFLLAALPEDTSMWRARSNAREMERPNQIARAMVEEILDQPDSPLPAAMAVVREYANYRVENEDLSVVEWHKLVDTGRSDIIDGCVNSVYQMLKTVPEYELQVMTPMLNVMSMSDEELEELYVDHQPAASEDVVGLGYRMRSYAVRQRDHDEKSRMYKRAVKSWEAASEANVVDPASIALYRFLQEEQEYEEMLASKYHHLLPFHGREEDWYEGWDELSNYGERMIRLEMMIGDRSLSGYKSREEAERVGREAYGQPGAGYLTEGKAGRSVLRNRLALMRSTYDEKLEEFVDRTHRRGLSIDVDDAHVLSERARAGDVGVNLSITTDDIYPFARTRGLDAHRIGSDFSEDAPIAEDVVQDFVYRARLRRRLMEDAREYLVQSRQTEQLAMLPLSDIESMNEFADRLESGSRILPSKIAEIARRHERDRVRRRARTIELDQTLTDRAAETVVSTTRERADELLPQLPTTRQKTTAAKRREEITPLDFGRVGGRRGGRR